MSSPKHRLILAIEADDDITDILYHGRRQWGEEQERRYAELLDRALSLLLDNPHLGRPRDDLQPGYRTHPVGQHLLVYRLTEDAIIVLRVLHARRDLRNALQEP